jgi:iron complex outermembrane receptor protein
MTTRFVHIRPIIAALIVAGASAIAAETNRTDLALLSLEQLSRVNVTGVSRHPEEVFDAAAAICVIRGTDIRRLGVTSLAEAMRLAPGLNVARIDSHTWAISARGLNSQFSRFLEVRQDGRSVYSPMFSGVYWDTVDTLLEDVDRIEVIRGPGATLWGANAVNGVINMITKSARDTQGLYLEAGGGTEERAFGALRYGGKLADGAWYRVYVKEFERADSVFANNARANDGWNQQRGGFRVDWETTGPNHFTFQGDLYRGEAGGTFLISTNAAPAGYRYNDRTDLDGGNLVCRWRHDNADGGDLMLQACYDHAQRDMFTLAGRRDTVDLDFQHRLPLGSRHQITWGLGYRVSIDQFRGSEVASFTPARRSLQLGSGFVQDEITLAPDRLRLTAGAKLEHNDYSGWEVQPGGRLAWTPTERQTYWGAVSRAVRTPARVDVDMRFRQEPMPTGAVPEIHGNSGFVSEQMAAYEAGWRGQLHQRMTADVAAFYNVYDHVRGTQAQPGRLPLPLVYVEEQNRLRGETCGIESVLRWQAADRWRWEAQHTFLQTHIRAETGAREELNAPHHQATLRTVALLPGNIECGAQLRFVDELAGFGAPGYVVLDARVAWKPTRNLELAVVGQNLGKDHHAEFPSLFTFVRTEVEQGVYGKLVWRY